MSISEKLQVIAENQQLVYQAGYDKGVAASGGLVSDDFVVNAPPKTIKTYVDNWSGGVAPGAFVNYTELETVQYNAKIKSIGGSAFRECTALRECKFCFADNVEGDVMCSYQAFLFCTNLEVIDFGNFGGRLGSNIFEGCQNLRAVIFRSTIHEFSSDPTNLTGEGPFDPAPVDTVVESPYSPVRAGICYIYVPSKYLGSYQEKFPEDANQFRALEDYTVDGTTTGELDETKI